MSAVLLLVFFVLVTIGAPIAFALGIGAVAAIISSGQFELVILPHKMLNGVNSFSMVAVPLFILAGNLAGETGISRRLVRLATVLVGHIPGGLALVNVLASMFFGGISGSAVADTASEGSWIIPAMKKEGYPVHFAAGITAASSTIGVLIPPSIPNIIYGLTVGVSIGALFMGGLIPGILVGVFQMIVAFIMSKKHRYPCYPRASFREIWKAFKDSILALFLPIIMMGGVVSGVATASEIAVVAVIYAFVVSVFIYKEYTIKQIPNLLIGSAVTSAIALLVVGVATVLTWMIAMDEIPAVLLYFFSDVVQNDLLVILLLNVLLLIIGCLMDLVPAMILFAPILLPVAVSVGIDPIQFGIVMTINLAIGLVTPPVGNCLFIAASIAKTDILTVFKGALPFLLVETIVLAMANLWKPVTMLLPSLFFK